MIMKNKNEKVVIKGHFSQVSEADRRRMELSIQKAKKEGKFPTTAQNSIPYKVMYKNGICQLEGNKFSKTIEFKDVNYELKDDDDKQITFDKLCKLYNHFSDDMHIQQTYMNTKIPMEDIYKSIAIKGQEDGYNELRDELTEILLDKERRGNKGNRNFKYITYTIEENDPRLAYQKLKDCDADIQGILNESGIKADNEVLDGTQRLSSIHAAFHPMGKEKFKAKLLEIGMVFQRFNLFTNKTVLENVTLAPLLSSDGRSKDEIIANAKEILDNMGFSRDIC